MLKYTIKGLSKVIFKYLIESQSKIVNIWILALNKWDDNGKWIDTENWKD